MSERQTFTAETFAAIQETWLGTADALEITDGTARIIDAALRIAANVMRPGLIEGELRDRPDANHYGEAIRKALLGD